MIYLFNMSVTEAPVPQPQEYSNVTEFPAAYKDSLIMQMYEEQNKKGWPFSLLVSDYDNSYFNEATTVQTARLAEIAKRHNIPTVIVTGNNFENLLKKIDGNKHAKPEVIIDSVGTGIYILHQNPDGTEVYVKDDRFDTMLKDMKFDRKEHARKAADLIAEWKAAECPFNKNQLDFQDPTLEAAFIDEKEVEVQPYKLSFYFFAHDEETSTDPTEQQERAQFEEAFRLRMPGVEIATCEEIGYNKDRKSGRKKFCIDALPIPPKAGAVNYLSDLLQVKQMLKVGDSGNDIIFQQKVHQGVNVVVEGAKAEMLKTVRNATPIGDTGFLRASPGKQGRYFNAEGTSTPAAGSIIDAAIARFTLSRRFITNEKAREEIDQIIQELEAAKRV